LSSVEILRAILHNLCIYLTVIGITYLDFVIFVFVGRFCLPYIIASTACLRFAVHLGICIFLGCELGKDLNSSLNYFVSLYPKCTEFSFLKFVIFIIINFPPIIIVTKS